MQSVFILHTQQLEREASTCSRERNGINVKLGAVMTALDFSNLLHKQYVKSTEPRNRLYQFVLQAADSVLINKQIGN